MVDVAAIFSEVFGPDDQDKGVSKKGCARCAGVSEGHKPLENIDNPSTPAGEKRHTSIQGVLNAGTGCDFLDHYGGWKDTLYLDGV